MQSRIDKDQFTVEIDLAPIDELYIHEEIVEANLISLIYSLKTSGFQRDPIIVDKESGVILDGMHRYSALKELGMEYIAVAKVDYFDENIRLKRWFRTYRFSSSKLDEFEKSLYEILPHGSTVEKNILSLNEGGELSYPNKNSVKIWINAGQITEYTVDLNNFSLIDRFRVLKMLEKWIERHEKAKATYLTEQQAINNIKSNKDSLVIGIPLIDKRDVVSVATRGMVFPPKTTRHIIPARPLFLNIPLKLLEKNGIGSDLESKRILLERFLENKMLIQVKGKVEIDRLYEENILYIFV